jgi:hypothetical protein
MLTFSYVQTGQNKQCDTCELTVCECEFTDWFSQRVPLTTSREEFPGFDGLKLPSLRNSRWQLDSGLKALENYMPFLNHWQYHPTGTLSEIEQPDVPQWANAAAFRLLASLLLKADNLLKTGDAAAYLRPEKLAADVKRMEQLNAEVRAIKLKISANEQASPASLSSVTIEKMQEREKMQEIEQMSCFARIAVDYKTLLYYDHLCMVIIPAHPELDTANNAQPTSFLHGKGSGRCSIAHVMVLPRQNMYNACTLDKTRVPELEHMRETGEAVIRKLASADSYPSDGKGNMNAPLPFLTIQAWRLAARVADYDMPYMPEGCNLSTVAAKAFTKELVSALQVYPNNSLGYLHMHIIAVAGLTQTGYNYMTAHPVDMSESGIKTPNVKCSGCMVPVDHVIRWLQDDD